MSDFSVPRRQELLGVVVIFFDNTRKFGQAFLAFVAYSFIKEDLRAYTELAALIAVLFIAAVSWMYYRRFTFHIESEQLILRKGILTRENVIIPFKRIQSVHLHQNFIQQVLGLTGVKVETAGSEKAELQIKALKKVDALSLQAALQVSQGEEVEVDEEGGAQVVQEKTTAKTLVKLSMWQLVQIGLTQNHIRNGFIAIGVIWGYAWQFNIFSGDMFDERIEEYKNSIFAMGMVLVVFGAVSFFVVSVLVSIVQAFLKYFNLEASLDKKAFRVSAGLLKRNEFTVPLRKIQMVEWSSNFLQRIPGFELVRLFQGQSEDSNKKVKVEIPACFAAETEAIMDQLFPEAKGKKPFVSIAPHGSYAFVLMSIFGFLGLLILVPAFVLNVPELGGIVYAIYLMLVWFLTGKYVKSVTLSTNGELLIYRRGWMFMNRTVIKSYKVQTLEWSQNILQKRRGTAHLTLNTAAGSRTLRFFPVDQVRELHDYFLYKIESSSESWM